MGFTKFGIDHIIFDLCVWSIITCIVLCQGEHETMLILDIDD